MRLKLFKLAGDTVNVLKSHTSYKQVNDYLHEAFSTLEQITQLRLKPLGMKDAVCKYQYFTLQI